MELNLKLKKEDGEIFHDLTLYWKLVGKLFYLTNTLPDLNYYVHLLSQSMEKPRITHYDAMIKVLKYVNGTLGQGIIF